jgi:sterol desaturase/sphingolipid hydroxylase (fatty acid hydroxylase superfamily)
MHEVFGIDHFDQIGVVAILFLLSLIEVFIGAFQNSPRTLNDYITEAASFVQLTAFIQPAIIIGVALLCRQLFPQYENHFASVPVAIQFVVFLLIEDMPQYWWHRLAHNSPWFWKLHLVHHASPAMGVTTSFRNGALYYLLMPNLYLAAVAIFLGFTKVYLVYTVVKLLIVMNAHSELRWDSFLYRYKILHQVAWLVEHTISTPATHFAHHGITNEDGISNNNGNFGNMLFIWDQLFGTAKFTRQYPPAYGIEKDAHDKWYVMLYYPFLKSKKKGSELK